MPDATQQQMPEPNPKTNPVIPKKSRGSDLDKLDLTLLRAHMYGRFTLHLDWN